MAKKAHRVGRYSRASGLAKLDHRTREGKLAEAVVTELTKHVGGNPSAAEQLLIRLAGLKTLRIALMAQHVLTVESITERDDRQFLAWANSLRRDLDCLGLKAAGPRQPRLAEVLTEGKAA